MARLWMATNLIRPCQDRSPDTSLPSTSAKVLSQLEIVPPFCGSGTFRIHAVDVDLAPVDRIVGQHDVLQAMPAAAMAAFGVCSCGMPFSVRIRAAQHEVIVLVGLTQREVARGVAARIADHVGLVDRHQRGRHPGLDRELAGRLDEVVELGARRGRRLRLAAGADIDAPAAGPA